MTGTPTLRPSEPDHPAEFRPGPHHTRSLPVGHDPAGEPPPLVAAVAQGVALVVVLPVRLLWELVAAIPRLINRYLLRDLAVAASAKWTYPAEASTQSARSRGRARAGEGVKGGG